MKEIEKQYLEKIKNFKERAANAERDLITFYTQDEGLIKLTSMITNELEQSRDVRYDEGGLIESYIEMPSDARALNEYEREAIQEMGCFNLCNDDTISWIVDMSDEAVIYDQETNTFFYDQKSFGTKEEALEYAEKQGVFPSVYSQGRYGDLSYYNN